MYVFKWMPHQSDTRSHTVGYTWFSCEWTYWEHFEHFNRYRRLITKQNPRKLNMKSKLRTFELSKLVFLVNLNIFCDPWSETYIWPRYMTYNEFLIEFVYKFQTWIRTCMLETIRRVTSHTNQGLWPCEGPWFSTNMVYWICVRSTSSRWAWRKLL